MDWTLSLPNQISHPLANFNIAEIPLTNFAFLSNIFSRFFFLSIISEESADSEEEPKEEEKMVPEEDHLVMLERVRKESEENRKFWQEEVLAMNKWRRHWLS